MEDAPDRLDPEEVGTSLRGLEQRLDRWPAPWTRRALAAWRAQRFRPAARAPAHFAAIALGGEASATELLSALRFALGAGACESSAALAERLLGALPTLPVPQLGQAAVQVVEALLMQGERARAKQQATLHTAVLSSSAAGVSLLELLELGDAALWLPDGRLNLLAASRRGCWSAEQVASELQGRQWIWHAQPELPLLFFSLLQETQTQAALRFLNRFLASHGLLQCVSLSKAEPNQNVLARFRFEAARARGGRLVSVLMAARNAAKTIVYALDSLLTQSYQTLEVLIGDDASDDGTFELIHERYGRDARVRLFRSTVRQGAYNVRNALAARARGSLITCHDADDLALPTRIAAQVEQLERAGVVGSVTSFLRVAADGRWVFFKNQKATRLSQVSLMLTREAFQSVGPFRSARVGADQELFAKLRARYGERALKRVSAPLSFGLWADGSETRHAGSEALEDGYRSPLRRLYSQLVFAQHAAGFPRHSSEQVDDLLRGSNNYIGPSELREIT